MAMEKKQQTLEVAQVALGERIHADLVGVQRGPDL